MRRLVLGLGTAAVLAFLPGLQVILKPTQQAPSRQMRLQGCTETGPCLDLPQTRPAYRLNASTGMVEICITGTNLGEGGHFLVNGQQVEATQWPTEFAFACLNVDATLGSGTIAAVRNDGARSNQVLFAAAAVIDRWEIPDDVRPGTSLFVHGKNLQHSPVLAPHLQEVRRDDDRIEFIFMRPGMFEVSVEDVADSTRQITVRPEVKRPCAAGPNTLCSLLVSHVGDSAQVVIAGLDAPVIRAEGAHLEVRWPEGLAAGSHPATVTVDGASTQTTVKKLKVDRETMLDFSPAADFISRSAYRPPTFNNHVVQTYFTHLQGSEGAQYGFNVLGRIPVDDAARAETSEGQFGFEQYLNLGDALNTSLGPLAFVQDQRLFLLGKSPVSDTLNITTFDATVGEAWSPTSSSGGTLLTQSRVAAARYFADTLVWLEGRRYSEQPQRVTVHGATLAPEDAQALENLFNDTSAGWLNDEAAFVTTCAAPDAPAGIARLELTHDDTVSLTNLSKIYPAEDPNLHILACHGTADGLYWVERREGNERLMFLANREAQPTELATFPADTPGVGARYERPRNFATDPLRWDPGLMVMQVADSGDAYFVYGLRDPSAPSIVLVKWSQAANTFAVGEPIPVDMNAVPGELCVGPWNDQQACGEIGQFGCGPFACDQQTRLPVSRPYIQPWEAELLALGEDVHVFLTVARTEQPSYSSLYRYELQYLKLARP